MKKELHFCILILFMVCCQITAAQKDNAVLLTVNEAPITVKEFKRVYLKNLEIIQDDTQKDVASYLDLYIEYKLKVQEAYRLGLDKKETYQKEFRSYKKQLSKGYLTDVAVTDALLKEAYKRTVEERNARHILVQVKAGAAPADTLKAYAKIIEAREKVLAGSDFKQIAKQYSDDPSAKSNGGELGWFKAFGMVYPFESAAYQTQIGSVSQPFRTQFGYHIVQPTAKRTAKGRVKVAHIMVALKQKDTTIDPEKRIQEINTLLNQGTAFDQLAKQYSDDKRSGPNGGVLLPFAQGQLTSTVFEDQAFALAEGETSQPFKTNFGWHIMRVLSKIPVGDLRAERVKLEDRLRKDSRAKVIADSLSYKLRRKYTIATNDPVTTFFTNTIPDAIKDQQWKLDTLNPELNKVALTVKDTTFSYKEVGQYLEQQQHQYSIYASKAEFVKKTITKFEDNRIKAYHETHLEEVDEDFAIVLNEYREGLLLFDLTETTIWNNAKSDTFGLQDYFDANATTYQWQERISYTVGRSSDARYANQARAMIADGKSIAAVESALNTKEEIHILFSNKTEPIATTQLPQEVKRQPGLSPVISDQDHAFYQITALLAKKPKSFDEARGQVISDYQTTIERDWIAGLKKQARIKIQKKTLSKLQKSLQ